MSEQKKQFLKEEEKDAAAEQIVFDLGVSNDKAKEWVEEAENELRDNDKLVTKQTVVVKTDAKHVDDEDVPANLEDRDMSAPSMSDHIKRISNAITSDTA